MRRIKELSIISIVAVFLGCFVCRADMNYSNDRNSGYIVLAEEDIPSYEGVFHFTSTQGLLSFDEKKNACSPNENTVLSSDNTYISTEEKDAYGSHILIAHVLIRDPSQINTEFSNGVFGGKGERPTDVAKRTGAVLVINGSYFNYGTGQALTEVAPVILHDNEIYRSGIANGSEICIRFDGSLFSPHPVMGFSAEDMYNLGVVSNIGTADPLLIQDGNLQSYPPGVTDGTYPRAAIGMVSPGEYYFLVAGSGAYQGGMSYMDMQGVFYALGCTYARSMDGGGSAAMVINGELLTDPAGETEREVADFICIWDR